MMTESDQSPDADWWQPVGLPGRTGILFPTANEQRNVLAGRQQPPVPLEATCVGRTISVELGADQVGVRDARHRGDSLLQVNPQQQCGTFLGVPLQAGLEEDRRQRGPLRRPHHWWRLAAGDDEWRWEYPNDRPPWGVVTTAAGAVVRSRAESEEIHRYSVRRLVAEWRADARPVDVLIAQLVLLAGWETSARNQTELRFDRGTNVVCMILTELCRKDYPAGPAGSYFRRSGTGGGGADPTRAADDAEPPTERAVAVVRNGSRLLVIHRRRNGRKYCVLPGGGVEPGETPAAAAIRELAEETGLRGTVRTPIFRDETDRPANYFLVDVDDPDADLIMSGPERDRASRKNRYRPDWIELSKLMRYNLQPAQLRRVVTSLP